jgi:hypothetical protein
MKRRMGIGAITGLGGGGPSLIDGKETPDNKLNKLIKQCSKEAYMIFFKGTEDHDWGFVDAAKDEYEIKIGIEPSYQYEPLKMLCITLHKEFSYISTGIAFGLYGTGIRQRKRIYRYYKRNSKFIKFVDKWHKKLWI